MSSGGRGEGAAGNKQEQPEAARRSGATVGTAAGTAAGAVRAEADRAARLPSVDELYQRYERFNRLYFENLLPRADDVTIEWSRRMTSAAGRCYTKRRIIRLSTHYHEKFPEEVDQTLLHEMIHLLVPNHGPLFHLWLRRIRERGGVVQRYSRERATPAKYRWEYTCRRCGAVRRTQRRLAHGGKYHRCRQCRVGVTEKRLEP